MQASAHNLETTGGAERHDTEVLEVELLLSGLAERYGYDLRGYSRASLMRRVRLAARREGASTVSALQEKVLHDPAAMVRFMERVAVHTTAMFRDADVYLALRRDVIPLLRTFPFIRIWHAGCSSGEEVYSLAILLQEEGLYDRCRLYATDFSDAVVERARSGIFSLPAIREHTVAYQKAGGQRDFSEYYQAGATHAIMRQSLKRNMIFSQHNLVCDGVFNEFHLIMCRNVMIYFDRELRERVHGILFDSLRKFGILNVGKKESLHGTPFEDRFEEMGSDLKIYRRVR
ncbi:MAG TPA: protein-glutamate O-methyltransferase CheR [Polyangia bacterium]|jgi:chemotaxis protein methyltransferase CheR|nr:protein-glutamate O-methyltransferase CheR [Polyangia bacterium]